MWRILYNLLIHLSLPFFLIFLFLNAKMRKTILKRLKQQPPKKEAAIWLHAASIGEAAIAESLVRYLMAHTHLSQFVITTNTYYTEAMLLRTMGRFAQIFFLPFDFPFLLRRFMRHGSFKVLLLVETEIWPNLIFEAKKKKIPVVVVNGRISEQAFRWYRRFSFFFRGVFSLIDLALVQDRDAEQRFRFLGLPKERVRVTGNMKYFRDVRGIKSEKGDVVTFGSIREKELDEILPVLLRLKEEFPSYRIFVAPRDLSLLATLERGLGDRFSVRRYSSYKEEDTDFVLVDTVGDLLGIYAKSKVAFVGGSLFPYGGQNILEPLFFGTPVLFGPHVENFREIAREVMERGAGRMVGNGRELLQWIGIILKDDALRQRMGEEAKRLIKEQEKVMEITKASLIEVIGH